jgi:hypothetical protein
MVGTADLLADRLLAYNGLKLGFREFKIKKTLIVSFWPFEEGGVDLECESEHPQDPSYPYRWLRDGRG